jgi:hypothetical protein
MYPAASQRGPPAHPAPGHDHALLVEVLQDAITQQCREIAVCRRLLGQACPGQDHDLETFLRQAQARLDRLNTELQKLDEGSAPARVKLRQD